MCYYLFAVKNLGRSVNNVSWYHVCLSDYLSVDLPSISAVSASPGYFSWGCIIDYVWGTREQITLVGWDCRIHRFHLCREIPHRQQVSCIYDTKPFDSEAQALKLSGIMSTPLLPLTQNGMADRVRSMGQKEMFDYLNWVETNNWYLTELWQIHSNNWNGLTVLTDK